MNINELIDLTPFAGKVDDIQACDLGVKLGGNDTEANLVPFTGAMAGTLLSAAEKLRLPDGTTMPGLVYNGLVKVKDLSSWDGSEMVPVGQFWDLSAMAQTLHFHLRNPEQTPLSDVRAVACDEYAMIWQKHVIKRHHGIHLRGVSAFRRGLKRKEAVITRMLATKLWVTLCLQMGDKAPETVDAMNGMLCKVKRYPLASRACVQVMRIRICEDPILAIFLHDKCIKSMGGDYDGDQVFIMFPEEYLASDQCQADMGTLETLPREEDPEWLGDARFSLTDVRAFQWPDGVSMVTGMGAKSLQGTVCNGFENLSIAASIVSAAYKGVCHRCKMKGVHSEDCTSLVARFDRRYATTAWVTGLVKESAFPVYEVVMDYRKSWKDKMGVEHANGEYAEELWDIVDVFRSLKTEFPARVGNIDKSDGDGKVGLDLDLLNRLMGEMDGEKLRDFIGRRPVQGSLVGFHRLLAADKRGRCRRLAQFATQHGLGTLLACATGHQIEEPDRKRQVVLEEVGGDQTDTLPTPEPPKPWMIGKGEMPVLGSDPWQFIAEMASWAGVPTRAVPAKGKVRLSITVKGKSGTRVFVLEMPEIKFYPQSGDLLGTVVVQIPGDERRTSRLVLRSRNRNLGRNQEVGKVELVTVLHLIGEKIAEYGSRMRRCLDDGTFTQKSAAKGLTLELDRLITKYARLAHSTDDGERMTDSVSFDQWEADVVLAASGSPRQVMDANTKLLEAIANGVFVNPVSGKAQRFDISVNSKNRPGCVAWLTEKVDRESARGTVKWSPSHPIIQYVGNGWIDSDRQMRESRTLRFACRFVHEADLAFTNGLESALPGITRRRRDAVWVAVSGEGWFFTDVKSNGDPGRITPFGMKLYERKSRQEVVGPYPLDRIEEILEERGVDGLLGAKAAGWLVTRTARYVGKVDGVSLYEDLFTLTSPLEGEPTWHKVYFCGHKFVATPTRKDYYVRVGDELVPVAGFVPIETLVQKKLHGSMAAGLCVLLGKTFFGHSMDHLVDPRRKAGDYAHQYADIVSEASDMLEAQGLPLTGCLPIVSEDGFEVGTGWAGVYPTFVLREDDKISSGEGDDCASGVLECRMQGERIALPRKVGRTMESLGAFIAGS